MRSFILITIILQIGILRAAPAFSQHFIGMHESTIKEVMKETHKTFRLNTSTVNPHYKYLKYEDNINEVTLLFFLSEYDDCTLV